MFDLNEFVEATTPVKVEIGEKEVNCVVRLNALSKSFLDTLKDNEDATYLMLEKMIASWDIAENGMILPVNVESLKRLPQTLITEFGESIASRREELKKPKASESLPS